MLLNAKSLKREALKPGGARAEVSVFVCSTLNQAPKSPSGSRCGVNLADFVTIAGLDL
jgi:hypothetical protein